MAALLVLGAIPSGLAGTAHSAETLYVIRFFIGILGATFVPCQAWTSAWFDKNCVGTANALVGGWGNMGGGATFAIMTSLYDSLLRQGLSQHVAWRAAFAIVPAPILLFVAALTMLCGQDHPVGKWSERHNIPATAIAAREGHEVHLDADEKPVAGSEKKDAGEKGIVSVHPVGDIDIDKVVVKSKVDIAVNEAITLKTAAKILSSPITWLPCLGYITTFGLELVIDATMADILFTRFNKVLPGFDQTKAGYYTSIFGFLNLVTRPYGGYLGDVVYRYWGTRAKKYWTILCGLVMGIFCLVGGVYLEKEKPHMPVLMAIFSISVIFSEFGNGANFALVPHCNPYNNGLMSGLVGSFGNLGGVIFAMVFRFQADAGKAYWIMGIICIVLNLIVLPIPVPKY
jgi:NNP family nitrate/nitrite transporter-like MFS transporter